MRISLRKWYLDATFPDGSAWIGYSALLRIGPLPAVRWCAVFDAPVEGPPLETARWGGSPEPKLGSSAIDWAIAGAGGGRWEAAMRDGAAAGGGAACAFDGFLADDGEIRARWRCVSPRARVVLDDGRVGTGYVEEMRLDLPRPRLPFRELWWGRAHAGEDSLVWIRWGAGRELSLILRDGRAVEGTIDAADDGSVRIAIPGETWAAEGGRALRDRDLRHAWPAWLVKATGRLPWARERKATGPVRVSRGGAAVEGQGIWEIVRWT